MKLQLVIRQSEIRLIKVKRRNRNEFLVVVDEKDSRTQHVVTLDEEYYRRFAGKGISKERLIERSFRFLLAREPKESILRRFNLKVISNYFPEYEKTMQTS